MDKCIDLLNYRNKIIKEVQNNFSELSSVADDAEIIKYSTPIDGIGKFCPSLINYRIHPNRKRSRLLNNKPMTERYVKYYISKCEQPLRIRKFNQYGCDSSTYFYRDNEYVCAVPLFRETIDDYGRNIYIYKIIDERVVEYAEIGTSSVYLEEYDYLNLNRIVCNMYEYYNSDFAFRDTTLSPNEINDFYSFLGRKVNEKLDRNIDSKEIKFLTNSNVRINKWKYEITQSNKVRNINEFIFKNDQWLFNRKV